MHVCMSYVPSLFLHGEVSQQKDVDRKRSSASSRDPEDSIHTHGHFKHRPGNWLFIGMGWDTRWDGMGPLNAKETLQPQSTEYFCYPDSWQLRLHLHQVLRTLYWTPPTPLPSPLVLLLLPFLFFIIFSSIVHRTIYFCFIFISFPPSLFSVCVPVTKVLYEAEVQPTLLYLRGTYLGTPCSINKTLFPHAKGSL